MKTDPSAEVGRVIVKMTNAHPKAKEIRIMQLVVSDLKQRKYGLFQNEVDYRVLFPNFEPRLDGSSAFRYRADLIGYTRDGFVITEFKLYDEHRGHMGPWGVLHFMLRDLRKLESAAQCNNGRLHGMVQFLYACRNASRATNQTQVHLMLEHMDQKTKGHEGRNPVIRSADFASVFEVFLRHFQSVSELRWKTTTVYRKGTLFLGGTGTLS